MASENVLPVVSPAQPSTRLHKGDIALNLSEMLERCIFTAKPLVSLADLRAQEGAPLSVDEVLDRISRRDREGGQ